MNKKIKVIELLNKIANGEETPIKIKWNYMFFILKQDSIDGHSYYEKEHGCASLVAELKTMDDLKSEVEILEDNTEEIEEFKIDENGFIKTNNGTWKGRKLDVAFANKINQLVRKINKLKENK